MLQTGRTRARAVHESDVAPSDFGSEGRGFESLRARHSHDQPTGGRQHQTAAEGGRDAAKLLHNRLAGWMQHLLPGRRRRSRAEEIARGIRELGTGGTPAFIRGYNAGFDDAFITRDQLAAALFYLYGNTTRHGTSLQVPSGPLEGYRPREHWERDADLIIESIEGEVRHWVWRGKS